MASRAPVEDQHSEESRKRKRETMEADNSGQAGAGASLEDGPSSKRPKTAEVTSNAAQSGSNTATPATDDGGKQSKVAALLAKRRAIQEQKAAMEKQISEVEKAQKEKEEQEKRELELREKALQARMAATSAAKPAAGPTGRGAGPVAGSVAPSTGRPVAAAAALAAPAPTPASSLFDLESIPKYQSTLKANMRFQQEAAEKQEKIMKKPAKEAQDVPKQPSRPHPAERKRRPLMFVEPGTYIRKAEEYRNYLEAQRQFAPQSNASHAPSSASAVALGPAEAPADRKKPKLIEDSAVDVEWWDNQFIEDGDYEKVIESKITHLVEHPVLLEPPAEKPPSGPLPLKLTPAEQKRLRKKLRAERLKAQQDRIMLGLEPAPKPRVRLANMMRVMGAEAIQDPTGSEKAVRAEMEAREKRHVERNEARKLTPEERREKLMKKFQEDTSLKSVVSVYRVEDISSGKHRFKVEKNAQQLNISGSIIIGAKFAVIISEGGPKGMKKFRKLMERRVKWEEKDDGSEFILPGTTDKKNKCRCIWNGEVLKAAFKEFRMFSAESDVAARKFLADRGVGHYWDMAAVFDDRDAVS